MPSERHVQAGRADDPLASKPVVSLSHIAQIHGWHAYSWSETGSGMLMIGLGANKKVLIIECKMIHY